MRTLRLKALAVALLGSCATLGAIPLGAQRATGRPNVVLIITDDVGYGDFGAYGSPDVKTPNIDRLARQGVKMTDFYANGPNCTPTRAGLISGRYQQRVAIEWPFGHATSGDSVRGLPVTNHSLPRLLADNGYATGLVGKWHLGYKPEFSPAAHGFGYFFGFKSGFIDYYQHTDYAGRPDFFENDRPIAVSGYSTDLITEKSVEFLARNKDKPFFLDVAYNAAHWPYQDPDSPSVAIDHGRHLQPGDSATNTRKQYVKIVERADRGVGAIMRALDSLGLAANTILIFTNDNGGEWLSRNYPLFHNKSSLWEGGIRVPAIVRWPGHIPAGTISGQVAITMDLSASILAATGTTVRSKPGLDGMNIFPILERRAPPVERTLFWRVARERNQRAVRSGDWKLLIDDGRPFLFDVRKDLGERNNLVGIRTDIVRKLMPLIDKWEADVDAEAKTRS